MIGGKVRPLVMVVTVDPSLRRTLGWVLRTADLDARFYGGVQDLEAGLAEGLARPCCLVLDAGQPPLDRVDRAARLAGREPPPIVFLADHRSAPASGRGGAQDAPATPLAENDLLAAVRRAIDTDNLAWARAASAGAARARFESLTPRERQILQAVMDGRGNRVIADELGLAEITVKTHRMNMMRKMAAKTPAELARLVEETGPLCVGARPGPPRRAP